jgi:folate-binding protein YgfZ
MKWCEVARDVVAVTGTDAESFLQGQLSQDVAAIDTGSSAWSFVLQPTGRVEVLCRVHRVNDRTFVLDTDGGWGEALVERLLRFRLRVDVDVSRLAWRCLSLLGADLTPGPGVVVGWWDEPGRVDLLGADVTPPEGAEGIGADEYERARIEAGWPAMGTELTSDTIPAEAGIVPAAVSFTKGCFTGQELVARIDSRGGNVPRHLRILRAAPGSAMSPGADVIVGAKEVGRVTSSAGDVALGLIARAVEPPAQASAGGVAVTVDAVGRPG